MRPQRPATRRLFAITWVGTAGSAADTTVTAHGTVLGAVALEDGADGALVTVTAGGQAAVTTVGAGIVDYTISSVLLVTAEVTVGTAQASYEVVGSPAAIGWVDTDGTAAATTVRVIRGTVSGTVILEDGADETRVTITAGGETAVKNLVSGNIEYTIDKVPLLTTEVTVVSAEVGFTEVGSPTTITWVDTAGSAPDVTVTGHGTVTGTVILKGGADDTLITITAGGETAVKNLVSGNIEYTISNVPLTADEVTVTSVEDGCVVSGSPSAITWVGTTGAALDITASLPAPPYIPSPLSDDGSGCTSGAEGGDGNAAGWALAAIAALAALGLRRPRAADGVSR